MVEPLGKEWFEKQDEHSLSCARFGDCIFDEVQKGAAQLEEVWSDLAKPWRILAVKAVKGKLFGFFPQISSPGWLLHVVFHKELWPHGLSKDEVELLHLVKAVSAYHPSHATQQSGDPGPLEKSDADATLLALRNYAALFRREIALPMWESFQKIAQKAGVGISPLCQTKYGENCSQEDAEDIFTGDLQRGWKLNTLEWSPATYHVFPLFIRWATS